MKNLKRIAVLALCAGMALSSGCGQASADVAEDAEASAGAEAEWTIEEEMAAEDIIEEYIEANTPLNVYGVLASEWLSVYVSNKGEANVTIRTLFYYAIPYVAEDVMPVAQEAVEASGAVSARFSVQSYQETTAGRVDGTLSSWSTTNWESGIYVSEEDGSQLPGMTIDKLLDYYSDYAELIESLEG